MFASGAYAQSGGAGGHGGWLVGLIGNAHQILQGQVNKATSSVGQEVNQRLGDEVTQANVKVLGHEAQLGRVVTALSYLHGIGFGVAAIAKFKAHKDNPTPWHVS